MMNMYKYLLFDADNTIFDFNKASKVAFKETLSFFELPEKEETYALYLKINKNCWEKLERGEITPQEIKSLRFRLFLEAINETGNPLEINDFYLDRLAEKDYLLEGAKPFLHGLKQQDYSLSIITNGLEKVQRPRIAKANLTDWFDAITVSEEIGCAKPAADFFEDTFRQLGQPDKSQVLVIGDNLKSDILGGQNIGVDTVWFNWENKANETGIEATYTATSFDEINRLVTSIKSTL